MRRIAIVVAAVVLTATVVTGTTTAGAEGQGIPPQRVLDTRQGLGAPAHRLNPGEVIALPLPTAAAAGATSASLNLTATEATGPGFLTVWPCGQPMPATSILNYVPGQTVANFVTLGMGQGGVCLASSAPVNVLADLMGWFTGGSDFRGAAPTRLLDTRIKGDLLKAGTERHVSVAGGAGYQGSGGGVALNVTVVNPAADGYVTVYPCGPRPVASTVNFRAGEIVPNFTLVPYTGGEVCLYAFTDTNVVVDSFGWSGGSGGLVLASPARLLDTRSGVGSSGGPASPSNLVHLRVAGRAGVPNDVAAAFITVTATGGTADGFVTAYPCDQPRPVASILNLRSGLLRSNLALVDLAVADGSVCLYAYTVDGSPVHLVADAVGWLPGAVNRPEPPPETNPPPPPPPPGGSGRFETLPVGSPLPSDAECAARVRPAAESGLR